MSEFAKGDFGGEHLLELFQATAFEFGQEEVTPDQREETDRPVDEADLAFEAGGFEEIWERKGDNEAVNACQSFLLQASVSAARLTL